MRYCVAFTRILTDPSQDTAVKRAESALAPSFIHIVFEPVEFPMVGFPIPYRVCPQPGFVRDDRCDMRNV